MVAVSCTRTDSDSHVDHCYTNLRSKLVRLDPVQQTAADFHHDTQLAHGLARYALLTSMQP
jgi:hypothetical protein